jgi:uncharacterized SAM-binding protein YcdF (DUF218 family)
MILNIVEFFVTPSHIIALLLGLGVVSVFLRKFRSLSSWLFVGGATLFFLFGSGPVAYYLIGNLEFRFPALHSLNTYKQIDNIVVLSGFAVPDNIYPISSQVNGATVFRLSEAIRLWRQRPSARLLLAGQTETTAVMKKLLVAMGVPEGSVIAASPSRNTEGNVESLKSDLKKKIFVLVTSAGHMPRAVMLFTNVGLRPIPAPTDFYAYPDIWQGNLFPSPFHLRCSDLAVHEYLALLYYRQKGYNSQVK